MPVNELHLCMGCMSPLFENGKCSVCGYDPAQAPIDINYLPPETRLGEQYVVGKMTSHDPEGAWYVGYDCREDLRVWVREYAPKALTMRDYDTGAVNSLPTAKAQYKALMSDFEDLCKSLRRLPPSEKVVPIVDMVYQNHTVYAIYRYIKMISLDSFLRRSGGKLSWRHTKKLLMPLFHTVANIHKSGLIHRGISPHTVLLDQSGALWLNCFSIAAARTHKSELTAQLFPGYAAPEQYSLNSWQGTWTDVYALGALACRAVTGEDPPSAIDRVYGDDLIDQTTAEMSEIVVTAINRALSVEVEDRIQTAEAFIAELLANEGSNTAVYSASATRKRAADESMHEKEPENVLRSRLSSYPILDEQETTVQPRQKEMPADPSRRRATVPPPERPRERRPKKKKRANAALLLFLSAIVATGLLGMGVYWFTTHYLSDLIFAPANSSQSEGTSSMVQGFGFSEEENTEEDGKTPKFVGATLSSIQENAAVMHRYQIKIEEVFNSDFEKGVVFDQQPVEGTALEEGASITLFVSKGTEMVDMPEVVDLPLEEAVAKMEELEIKYQVIEVYNNAYEPDIIVRCDPLPGTEIDKNETTVILYIKKIDLSSSSTSREEVPQSSEKSSSSRIFYRSSESSSRLLKPRQS